MQFTKKEEDAIIKSTLHLEKLDEILENNPNITANDFFNEYYGKVGVVFTHHTNLNGKIPMYRARIEDDKITNVSFTGGCNGNLKAISILVNGMTVSQIEEKLKGNLCGTRSTSCADQLAIAVREAFESKKA